MFTNDDGSLKKEGEIIRRPQLANTFRKIAAEGADTFYNGSLAKDIIADLEEAYLGTSITAEDLREYRQVKLEKKMAKLLTNKFNFVFLNNRMFFKCLL